MEGLFIPLSGTHSAFGNFLEHISFVTYTSFWYGCCANSLTGQGIGFYIFSILTCMQSVLSKDLLIKFLNAYCEPGS